MGEETGFRVVSTKSFTIHAGTRCATAGVLSTSDIGKQRGIGDAAMTHSLEAAGAV